MLIHTLMQQAYTIITNVRIKTGKIAVFALIIIHTVSSEIKQSFTDLEYMLMIN